MATDCSDRRGRPVRHGVAVAILLFLPLFALAGVFAPGMVAIVADEEQAASISPIPADAPPIYLPRKPILIGRDYTNGFMPELLNLDGLFAPNARGDFMQRIAGSPAFALQMGEALVIDDIEDFVSDTLFKDVLKPSFVSDKGGPFDQSIFDLLPSLLGADTDYEFDDMAGTGDGVNLFIIPEPSTFVLVGLGLIGLARAGRQRQPATS